MAVLITDQVKSRAENKGLFHQEDIAILKVHTRKNRASKYNEQKADRAERRN